MEYILSDLAFGGTIIGGIIVLGVIFGGLIAFEKSKKVQLDAFKRVKELNQQATGAQ